MGARKDDVRENVDRTRPQFGDTTDPQVLYCEPPGVPHIYLWPIKTKFIQTPEAVYILHELGPFYRIVWLNSKHPEDPDPQWWGHSIGWYENGDTLVVDTDRLHRQDVARSDGPSAHRAAASDRALQARGRDARWSSTW